MLVICTGFTCTPLANGSIRLEIREGEITTPSIEAETLGENLAHATHPPHEPPADKLLTRAQVAKLLGVSTRTITNLQRRERHPLVFSRATGRPRIWESVFHRWLAEDKNGSLERLAIFFGAKVKRRRTL